MADLSAGQDSATDTNPTETPAEDDTAVKDERPAAVDSGQGADSLSSGADAAVSEPEAESLDSEAAEEPPAPAAPTQRSRPGTLVIGLAAALVALLALNGWLLIHNHGVGAEESDRSTALQTAQDIATNLTTITAENAAAQIDSLNKQSTGSFKDQISGYSSMFQAVLKQGNVASKGDITAAGVEKLEGDSASAVITVSAVITSGEVPQGQRRSYRLLVSLQRDGDHWLASNVDIVR